MKCKLLIVSNGKSFLIDSVIADLDPSWITTVCCEYDVKSIGKEKDDADIVLVFVGELSSDVTKGLVYIKDICSDDSKSLYLAGYDDDIAKAKEIIPHELVKKTFFRPFDAKKMVSEIEM